MGIGDRTFGARERADIISAIERAAEQGRSVGATARDFGITGSVYYRWIRERARGERETGVSIFEYTPARRTRRRLDVGEKDRLIAEMRRRHDGGESIQSVALAVGLPENSCWRWLRQTGRPPFWPVEVFDDWSRIAARIDSESILWRPVGGLPVPQQGVETRFLEQVVAPYLDCGQLAC